MKGKTVVSDIGVVFRITVRATHCSRTAFIVKGSILQDAQIIKPSFRNVTVDRLFIGVVAELKTHVTVLAMMRVSNNMRYNTNPIIGAQRFDGRTQISSSLPLSLALENTLETFSFGCIVTFLFDKTRLKEFVYHFSDNDSPKGSAMRHEREREDDCHSLEGSKPW